MTRHRCTSLKDRLLRATLATAAISVSVVTASCRIPQDKEPQRFALPPPQEQALKEPATTTSLPPTRTAPQTLYFIKVGGETDTADELVPVTVPVRESGPAEVPKAVLDQLIKGPTAEQRAQDLRSSVPESAQVDSVRVQDGIATVNFGSLGTIEGRGQRLAAAQIVFTLTELVGIEAVRFIVGGNPASVPLGNTDSSAPGDPVGRKDYPQLEEVLVATTTAVPEAPVSTPPPGK